MPLAGFEPVTPATKRLQTYALDRAATGIGYMYNTVYIKYTSADVFVTYNSKSKAQTQLIGKYT
jgi:hypothetical protein